MEKKTTTINLYKNWQTSLFCLVAVPSMIIILLPPTCPRQLLDWAQRLSLHFLGGCHNLTKHWSVLLNVLSQYSLEGKKHKHFLFSPDLVVGSTSLWWSPWCSIKTLQCAPFVSHLACLFASDIKSAHAFTHEKTWIKQAPSLIEILESS